VNGDSQKIYNAINQVKVDVASIKTKQEENHRNNQEDISVLFKKLAKLDNLPCNVHKERMGGFKTQLYYLWGAVSGILIWLANTHFGE